MEDPYESPKTVEATKEPEHKRSFKEPVVGCGVGGCAIPMVLLLIASVSGDIGGPLVWPILCIVLGFMGLIVGIIVRVAR